MIATSSSLRSLAEMLSGPVAFDIESFDKNE